MLTITVSLFCALGKTLLETTLKPPWAITSLTTEWLQHVCFPLACGAKISINIYSAKYLSGAPGPQLIWIWYSRLELSSPWTQPQPLEMGIPKHLDVLSYFNSDWTIMHWGLSPLSKLPLSFLNAGGNEVPLSSGNHTTSKTLVLEYPIKTYYLQGCPGRGDTAFGFPEEHWLW